MERGNWYDLFYVEKPITIFIINLVIVYSKMLEKF